jgi:hypothetical protein
MPSKINTLPTENTEAVEPCWKKFEVNGYQLSLQETCDQHPELSDVLQSLQPEESCLIQIQTGGGTTLTLRSAWEREPIQLSLFQN